MLNVYVYLKNSLTPSSDNELFFHSLTDDEPDNVRKQFDNREEFIFLDNNKICLRRDEIIGYIFDEMK